MHILVSLKAEAQTASKKALLETQAAGTHGSRPLGQVHTFVTRSQPP